MKAIPMCAAALILLLSGYAASVNTVSRVTYQDPTFDLAKLQLGASPPSPSSPAPASKATAARSAIRSTPRHVVCTGRNTSSTGMPQ